jgi:thymidylate synthase
MYNNGQYVYRYELSRNQVNELIKDIQENPYGRRHIISFWNWANIQEKALVECAYETLWNVRGEYLDMTLIQRSGDMLTASGAGGMNEIQYAALLMMIARHTGYKAGVFCHFVQNEQIYDRHEEQAIEIFNRFKKLLVHEEDEIIRPELVLNPEKNNFYDFTIEDFTLLDYEPIRPQLKLDLGI